MAARKTSKAANDKSQWQRVREIWGEAGVADWLSVLQRIHPQGKWTRHGNSVMGCCPYHDDKTPSFNLNFTMRLGKCFACGQPVTDIVQLIARLLKQDYGAALMYLRDELGIKGILAEHSAEIAKHHELQEMKKAVAVAHGKLMAEYVRDKPKHLEYLDVAAAYLEKGRGVPVSLLPQLPVSIFSKPEHVKQYVPEKYHALYDSYFKAVNTPAYWGSVLFWYNDSMTTISNFKLRVKSSEVPVITSGVDDLTTLTQGAARCLFGKQFLVVKDPCAANIGVYGLHYYARHISDSNTAAVITEGEFDALAIMVEQLKSGGTMDFPVFAGGGGAGTDFSFLREYWLRTLYVVADAPGDKKGVELAYKWLKSPANHAYDVNYPALKYKIYTWPQDMAAVAGDLDDMVRARGYDAVKQSIWLDSDFNYLNELPWVTKHCDAELAEVTASFACQAEKAKADGNTNALANLEDEKRSKIREVVAYWLQALHDKVDKSVFVTSCESKTGVDITLDDSLYAKVYDVNTVDGAKKVVADALFSLVSIPYYRVERGTMLYCLYSRTLGTQNELSLNSDSAILTTFSHYVGGDFVEWLKKLLRNSVVITPPAVEAKEKYGSNPSALCVEEARRASVLMNKILQNYVPHASNKKDLTLIGQGIHYKDVPRNNNIYFVNGSRIFKGVLGPASGARIEWTQIRDIRDGDYCFLVNNQGMWSQTVTEVKDLYYGLTVDKHKLYANIRTIIDAWLFEDHATVREFLPAYIMSLPVQLASQRVSIMYITGDSTSGKTALLQGLLGGADNGGNDVPSIFEASKITTNSSEAYMYQCMDRSSLMFGIDEAETNDEAAHNKRMQDLVKLMYSVPTGGSRIGRGSASNSDPKEYVLNSPITCNAIHLPTDDVFKTRIFVVHTKKDYSRPPLRGYITSKFDDKQLCDIRKSINTALLADIPRIIERRRELELELSNIKTNPPVTSRFISVVSTALTVYEMCGSEDDPHDAAALFVKLVEANKERLRTVFAADTKSPLIDNILYARVITHQLGDSTVNDRSSPRDLIMTGLPDSVTALNNSKCGVYYLATKCWIVLYWRQIKTAIFGPTYSQYRGYTESALKEAVSKNKYLIEKVSMADHRSLVNKLGITDARTPADYTVFDVGYLSDSLGQQPAITPDLDAHSQGAAPPEPPMSVYDDEGGGAADINI